MSNTTSNNNRVLVIGSNGKSGRRIFKKLSGRGVPVVGATHSGNPKFDWNDSTTWENVLNNISAVYISYYPDVAEMTHHFVCRSCFCRQPRIQRIPVFLGSASHINQLPS